LPKTDNFLADAVRPKTGSRLSYRDGFRFGVGFFIANLFLLLILGGMATGIVLAFHLH
jgi:hypothetical protein